MNKQQTIDALEAAIRAQTETGPVAWSVNDGDGYVQLVGIYDSPDEDDELATSPDLSWKKFGGDAILAAAGLTDQWGKSGTEGYEDCYGDDVVSDWVEFSVEDDEQPE